jgi:hypothetical protein
MFFFSEAADPCETAFQMHKCYHDENPEVSTKRTKILPPSVVTYFILEQNKNFGHNLEKIFTHLFLGQVSGFG